MLGHKLSFYKFKKIEIISSIFQTTMAQNYKLITIKKMQRHSNTWRLNTMLLNNEWISKEIKEKIKNFLQINENKHTTAQNLWYAAKAILREKFIALQVYFKKQEKFQIDYLTLQLKEPECKQKENPRASKGKK
uniref:Uncharacterized protein n=1 Tax=Molossus molossus TaxID=27622 RepID=A0A7J8GL16_MOLMO|nr:hypothetical protein HJG59_011471 [Molossus molossus]